MFGFEIQFGFNGKLKPIETVQDLHRVYQILGLFLESEGMPISNSSIAPPMNRSVAQTHTVEPLFALVPMRQPRGKKPSDYAIQAAQQLGRPVTVRELGNKMAEIGWKSGSEVQRNILSGIRYAMKEAGFVKLGEGYWEYKPNQTTATDIDDDITT